MKVSEVARIAGVSHTAVLNWIAEGRIKPVNPDKLPGVRRLPAYRLPVAGVASMLGISEAEARRRLADMPTKPRRKPGPKPKH